MRIIFESFICAALVMSLSVPAAARSPAVAGSSSWLEDCASQLLAHAMLEEARTRVKARTGRSVSDSELQPTREDLERAWERILATLDHVMILSGLVPLPHPRPEPESPAPPPRKREIAPRQVAPRRFLPWARNMDVEDPNAAL